MYYGICVDKFCAQEQNGQGKEFSQTEYCDDDKCEEAFYDRMGLTFPSKRCPACRKLRDGYVDTKFICEV